MQNIINKGLIFGVVPVADSLKYLAQDHVLYTLPWLAAVYYMQNILYTNNEKLLQSAESNNCAIWKKTANNQKNYILKIMKNTLNRHCFIFWNCFLFLLSN